MPVPTRSAVEVVADGCPSMDARGSGLVVAPGRVITSAHVIAGATSIEVRTGRASAAATVVAFDPYNDLAILAVDDSLAPAVPLGSTDGGDGVMVVVRDGRHVALPVSIVRPVAINTADIYGNGEHRRAGFELDADVVVGDSGGVVIIDGRAVAVVFARSRLAKGRAWAIDPSPITDRLTSDGLVGNGHCTR